MPYTYHVTHLDESKFPMNELSAELYYYCLKHPCKVSEEYSLSIYSESKGEVSYPVRFLTVVRTDYSNKLLRSREMNVYRSSFATCASEDAPMLDYVMSQAQDTIQKCFKPFDPNEVIPRTALHPIGAILMDNHTIHIITQIVVDYRIEQKLKPYYGYFWTPYEKFSEYKSWESKSSFLSKLILKEFTVVNTKEEEES